MHMRAPTNPMARIRTRKTKKYGYTIAAVILAVAIAMSPVADAAVTYAAEAEEDADSGDKTEEKEEKDQETENGGEGATSGTAEGAAEKEPPNDLFRDPTAEKAAETASPESSVQEALWNELTAVPNDAILLIRIGYEFKEGDFDEWARGTGFIVSPRCILTRQSLIDTRTDTALLAKIIKDRGAGYKQVGVNLQDVDTTASHIKYYVTDRFGNTVEVSDSSMKNGLGLIVTKKTFSTPACVFADVRSISLPEGTVVHAKTAGDTGDGYTVKTLDGTVYIDEKQTAGFSFVMDAAGGAPIGAPVYDGEGHVIGLIASDTQDMTSYSAKALEAFLSMNGVEYRSIEQIEAESSAMQTSEAFDDIMSAELDAVDKSALEDAISNYAGMDTSAYTEESAAALDEAIKNAKEVAGKEGVTQEEVDTARKKLDEAASGLIRKGFLDAVKRKTAGSAGKIAGVIFAVIAGVLLFLVRGKIAALFGSLFRKRAKNKKEVEGIIENSISDEDDYRFDQEADYTVREAGRGHIIPKGKGDPGLPYADEKDEPGDRATDLSAGDDFDGSSDTTVLTKKAYLIRTKTNKKIPINKKEFTMGKLDGEVDYCIADVTVSRHHCVITQKNGEYFLTDLKSKNHTFLEGRQIPENKEVRLKDGNRFRLSGVEFEFHIENGTAS